MSLKEKVFAFIQKCGNQNGHASPKSQDPSVAQMHEYAVSTMCESYFKARREKAKQVMLLNVGPDAASKLDKLVKNTKKTNAGETVEVASNEYYTLQATSKKGAAFLDTDLIKVEMLKVMPRDKVDAIWAKASQQRDPAISYVVVENGGTDNG